MRPELLVGDVLQLKRLRVIIQDGAGWMEFQPPKGYDFVVLLLGHEKSGPDLGNKLDVVERLHEMGWYRKDGKDDIKEG